MKKQPLLSLQSQCSYPTCISRNSLPLDCLNLQRNAAACGNDHAGCIAAQLNQLLLQHNRQSMRLFHGDLIKAFLVLEISNRHPVAQADFHHVGAPFAFSNIHSLADATGIPRETVRRKIRELISANWVTRLADGGLVICKERLAFYRDNILPTHIILILNAADKIRALQTAQNHR